jgi:hypothetical protein
MAREAGYIAAGVVGATLALLPVSMLVLGYWPFFMKQIELAKFELGTPEVLARMWGTGNDFLMTAYRLFPPAFLLVFGLALLVVIRKRNSVAWPAFFALLLCSLLYCYQEFVMHGVALRVPYHSVYLVVPIYLCAGTVLGELWQRATWRRDWIPVAAIGVFVASLPFLGDAWRHELGSSNLWGNMTVTGAVALVLLAGWRSAPAVFRIPLALVMFGLLFVGPSRELLPYTSMRPHVREDFDALMNLESVLKASKPAERQAMFWLDEGETHQSLFLSAQALWNWGPMDFTKYIATSSTEELRSKFQANPTLVQLTDRPEKIAEHLKILDSRGVAYENHRQWVIRDGQSQFYVAAEDLINIWQIH